ncbi:permease-like cell division protein FtsX [Actinobacillus equuli subsp. equuli]|uniref:Cell division protein FtsX n=1 Tax=Actinobacillus equuli subsp. equuli TaxID=202947 RepID=A0A9X4G215_ACTEU|nr:permease-like cell division protein FtsX [Actinobacillus equuli]MDE8034011.1 permease-like cell division protein FtsX [Actinobacillus equuli subsp. equuli]MDG4949193.1 permease-like cell division protein FtsX [Actinobacillus equuli subsp. haemolyticus]WGE48688.1 permease-like cell division protein FtsX [Actinobacillus equuli subsp. equuli]WGE55057.1 permease-like cell division protein FtsX [Actinobacillus equuli subsp. equuli]WGE57137.1 permease-like cell division protein FtsX [Actinobacill
MARSFNTSFGAQTRYTLRSVWQDLLKRKFGTFLTVLVIAVSLTIPTVSYLLWKNTHQAATEFYPEPELTIYLHKNLAEHDVNAVVERIRHFDADKIESLNYISRQQSLDEFRSWSGFGEALDIIDDNPLPAVVTLKPKKQFTGNDAMLELRNGLQAIKGVQEVRLDNGWLEKLTALTWLIARIAMVCTVLMLIAVFLVVGNAVRTDVANSKASIEVQQLLGATDHFIARPFLYTGMIYGFFGSLLAILFSAVLISYFTGVVKYVTDMFTVKFELNGLDFSEIFFLIVACIFIGWLSAKIATNRHIHRIGSRY